MSVVRRFLVAPSLVRLIRKERGGARITEGYFAPQGGRVSFVRVDGQQCHLVLIAKDKNGASFEERTEVPRAHGDALLDVCPGKAAYERTSLQVAGREALIDRYVSPGSLDIVSVAFEGDGEARGFAAPAWFGREVTDEEAYDRQSVALQGPPQGGEVALSNAALDAVLDLLEPRFGFGRYNPPARGAEPRSDARPAPKPEAKPESRPESRAEPKPEPQPENEAFVAPAAVAAAAPEPVVLPAPHEEHATPAEANAASDARIDDVIESLSQALGAAIQQPASNEPNQPEDPVAAFERWTVRPRRTQPQS